MKKIGLALVALLGMGIFGIMTAIPAFAHHPIVSGSAVCSTDGTTVKTTWSLQNSESVTGTNRSMHVVTAIVDHGTLSGIAAGTTVTPQPTAGSTVYGTTTVPSNLTGTITLTVHVNFDSPGPQDVVGVATVTLPMSCPHPTTSTSTTVTPTTTTVPVTTTKAPVTTTTLVTAPTTTTKAPTAAVTTTTTKVAALATTGGPATGEAALALWLVVAGLLGLAVANRARQVRPN